MAYRHTYVFADGITQNPSGTPVVPYPLITANGNYPSDLGFLFQGGAGQFAVGGTLGGGTYQIQQRLPDGLTWVNIPGAVLTAPGLVSFTAAESSRIRLVVSGATAPSASAWLLDLPQGSAFANVNSTGGGTGGSSQVEGNVPSGAADAGNPVKVGAKYNATQPTYLDGQRTDFQATPRGNLLVSLSDGAGGAAVTGGLPSSDGQALQTVTHLRVMAAPFFFDGTNWARGRGDTTSAFTKPPPLAKTDRSLTLSTTSQQVAAANATRSRVIVKNNDATISAFINFGAAATTGAGSVEVAAKGFLELTGTNQALNAIAASGTPTLTVWEF